ncbi:DUF1178 family protein [Citreimonas salinaria]|uniref:DUF1178 family protein n=1 Tax=Citreimonas salinaria TaxID=321339 RepID=A0A1H3MK25_9RHOB|nr:DUF1178 family protein [Citreimonas salinaria]SDY77031.1 hypothetical protein SAMN05444340_11778 [Citreimonas salinaria]
MIRYSLKCADGHVFDSWFQSAAAYDSLQRAGHVSCAVCGDATVDKAPMAPRVSSATTVPERPLSPAEGAPETALTALKRHIEANSDYVGRDFAREARAIHDGDSPRRAIWGEARGDEARQLVEDGVPIAPLPFTPTRKAN